MRIEVGGAKVGRSCSRSTFKGGDVETSSGGRGRRFCRRWAWWSSAPPTIYEAWALTRCEVYTYNGVTVGLRVAGEGWNERRKVSFVSTSAEC